MEVLHDILLARKKQQVIKLYFLIQWYWLKVQTGEWKEGWVDKWMGAWMDAENMGKLVIILIEVISGGVIHCDFCQKCFN